MALLIWYGIACPPRHDLGLLVGLLPEGSAASSPAVAGLTVHAVKQCYVAASSDPLGSDQRRSWDETVKAIATAEDAVSVVAADLAAMSLSDPDR
jgi:hypothetical protein